MAGVRGASGRRPAPAKLKLLNGRSPGRDSSGNLVKPPPPFERAAPEPPDWLSAQARKQWALCAPSLERLDLLKGEDQAAFTAFCETWATYVEALHRVRAEGLTITNPQSGLAKVNPAFSAMRDAQIDLLRFGREFGLTPASEQNVARLPGRESDDDDPLRRPLVVAGGLALFGSCV